MRSLLPFGICRSVVLAAVGGDCSCGRVRFAARAPGISCDGGAPRAGSVGRRASGAARPASPCGRIDQRSIDVALEPLALLPGRDDCPHARSRRGAALRPKPRIEAGEIERLAELTSRQPESAGDGVPSPACAALWHRGWAGHGAGSARRRRLALAQSPATHTPSTPAARCSSTATRPIVERHS